MKIHDNGFVVRPRNYVNASSIYVAWDLAQSFHAGQMYGDHAYVYHLAKVANKVAELYMDDFSDVEIDQKLKVIAWLHDVIEDTHCTKEDLIACNFEEDVILAVEAITKLPEESREIYLGRVKKNFLAFKVKMADTLANLEESIASSNKRLILKYTNQIKFLCEVEND